MQKSPKREFRISSVESWDIPFSILFPLVRHALLQLSCICMWRGDSICSSGSLSEGEDRFAIEDTSACKRSFVNRHINLTLVRRQNITIVLM